MKRVLYGIYVSLFLCQISYQCFAQASGALSIRKNVFAPGERIIVDFLGWDKDANYFLAIAREGSDDRGYMSSEGGLYQKESGTKVIETKLTWGNYEIRVYSTASKTVLNRQPFRVGNADTVVRVQTKRDMFAPGENIEIIFSGIPGDPKDWIAVSNAGSAGTSYIAYKYTNGLQSGNMIIEKELPSGDYEARVYFNEEKTVRASYPFRIGNADNNVKLIAADPRTGGTVEIYYSGLPGNKKDWIAIALAGTPDNKYLDWEYTNGVQSGTLILKAPSMYGNYEIRAYLNDSKTVIGRSPIHVGGSRYDTIPVVATTKNTYYSNQRISVGFHGFPGNEKDWISVAPVGSPVDKKLDWYYTSGNGVLGEMYNRLKTGVIAGRLSFDSLPPGVYEIRGYFNNEYVVRATHIFKVVAVGTRAGDADRNRN